MDENGELIWKLRMQTAGTYVDLHHYDRESIEAFALSR